MSPFEEFSLTVSPTFLLKLCWCPFHTAVTRAGEMIITLSNQCKMKTSNAHKNLIKSRSERLFSSFLWVVFFAKLISK